MKVRFFISSIIPLLLSSIFSTLAEHASSKDVSTASNLVQGDAAAIVDVPPDREPLASKGALKGTLDAPVDGKDGKPHHGPWVDTNAESDRNKGVDADGQTVVVNLGATSSVEHTGPDGNPILPAGDGVMDDPYRPSPKEGTRGTEGGVSEKSKDKSATEKVPETPKDAPPLPLSEQRKIFEIKDTDTELSDVKTPSGDQNLEVGSDYF
jgi:Ca2+/H+ antiporter, TMEM165/GDT1 family